MHKDSCPPVAALCRRLRVRQAREDSHVADRTCTSNLQTPFRHAVNRFKDILDKSRLSHLAENGQGGEKMPAEKTSASMRQGLSLITSKVKRQFDTNHTRSVI